ncbi:helix-turn-helix domain-containing protein [Isoptericola rhizosphaerae]|uniref:helix-turn-helix domain-containing protein n=1 Tax=Isoptericola rhizosphaerae TaxID=3377837 RepID=UPI00383BC280
MEPYTRVPNRVLLDPSLSPTAKTVYAALASHVSNGGTTCWPGGATLAKEAGVSRRSVTNALAVLKAAGLVTWTTRTRDGSFQKDSNLYTLPLQGALGRAGDAAPMAPDAVPMAGDAIGVRHDVPEGMARGAQELDEVNKTHLNQTKEPDRVAFEDFWAAYPIKASYRTARVSWQKALEKTSPDVILEAARRHAADPNRVERYTRNPHRWLDEEGWQDGPARSRDPERPSTDRQAEILRREMAAAMQHDEQQGLLQIGEVA